MSSLFRQMVVLIILLTALTFGLRAQENDVERVFSGIVLDAESFEPLPDVILRVGDKAYAADEAGRVGAFATLGDTLCFSHIGYMSAQLVVVDSMYIHNIFSIKMSRDTVRISEIVVLPRPMRLAENSRFMPLDVTLNNEIAKYNFNKSTYLAKTQASMTWDAEMNQKASLNRYQSEQVNRHMISENQMIGISTAAIPAIISLVKKLVGKTDNNGVELVNQEEVRYLLR